MYQTLRKIATTATAGALLYSAAAINPHYAYAKRDKAQPSGNAAPARSSLPVANISLAEIESLIGIKIPAEIVKMIGNKSPAEIETMIRGKSPAELNGMLKEMRKNAKKEGKKGSSGEDSTVDRIAEDEDYITSIVSNFVGGVSKGLIGAVKGVKEAISDETEEGMGIAKSYFTRSGLRARKLIAANDELKYSRSATGKLSDELDGLMYDDENSTDSRSAAPSGPRRQGTAPARESLLEKIMREQASGRK